MKTINMLLALILFGCSFAMVVLFANCDGTPKETTNLVPDHFLADGLVKPISEVPCTLSNGTETTCYQIEIKGVPTDHKVGPFCPRSITDSADVGGIWFHDGKVYDVDGAFIKGLAALYDSSWKLYDDATGQVNVTTTQEACEAAARPDVAAEYQNHCVECSLDYVNGGVPKTILLPKTPVALTSADQVNNRSIIGLSLNGAHFDPPAPVDAIIGAKTIAAFDDCGGHVNPNTGYHYHAAMGCGKKIEQSDGHSPLIGYALDGYGIYARTTDGGTEPTDLDSCRGHTDSIRGYHYHAASPAENKIVGCFHGAVAMTTDGTTPTEGGTPPGDGGPPPGDAGGPSVVACTAGQTSGCCGDGTCDGPETLDNCSADCK